MNELYLFVGEQQNLLKVLKSMIGLSHDASVHQLLSGLRTALDLADGAQPQFDPAANPKAAPSAAGAHRAGGTAAAVAGDSEAQQLRRPPRLASTRLRPRRCLSTLRSRRSFVSSSTRRRALRSSPR